MVLIQIKLGSINSIYVCRGWQSKYCEFDLTCWVYSGKSIIDNETGRSSCVCLQRSSRIEAWYTLISRFILCYEKYLVALTCISFLQWHSCFLPPFYCKVPIMEMEKFTDFDMNLIFPGLVHTYLALSKIKEALYASREAMKAMPQSAKALKLVGDVHASNSSGREKVTSQLFEISILT